VVDEGSALMLTDGRNIEGSAGSLTGEAAGQRVKRDSEAHAPLAAKPDEAPSYYGRPLVKEPVWIPTIPLYFYVGGVTGCAGVVAAAAQLSGDESLRPFVRRLRWMSALGAAVSSGLLVSDLGRPSRFLNMLRVFRPTSPMSMGSWLLAAVGAFSGAAALLSNGPRPLRAAGDVAALAAAAVDLPFTGYTAVLIANSAVPVWQGARRSLPPLFIFASVASTGALLQLTESEPRTLEIGRRLAVGGKVLELAAGAWVKRELSLPEVRRPLQEGRAGALWKAGKVLGVAALGLSLLPAKWRWAQRAAGVLGTAAVVATKLAVFNAGKASAQNPHASFEMQRRGQGAAAVGRGSTLVQLKVEGRPLMAR
jgi:formate-dependent nitrite reductase membrane component NrfD